MTGFRYVQYVESVASVRYMPARSCQEQAGDCGPTDSQFCFLWLKATSFRGFGPAQSRGSELSGLSATVLHQATAALAPFSPHACINMEGRGEATAT